MISFGEATRTVLDNVSLLPRTERAILDAVGYCLAEAVVAGIDVVSYRNSAMDGFAVCAEWLSRAAEGAPVVLPYRDTVFAGDDETTEFVEGVATKIMTGAPVPGGFDAVVPFELTTYDKEQVTFTQTIAAGANVRQPGEDIKAGQTVFEQGHHLGRLDIGILASLGLVRAPVFDKPSVLIATTGNELATPGKPLPSGAVYNSNLYTMDAMIWPFSRSLEQLAGVGDDIEQLRSVMESDTDVIVTSGGVSAGERDLVIDAAEAAGFESILHKVRIKPGKPVYYARRGRQMLFGLPGNPLSTAVTAAVFVLSALKKMSGRRDYMLTPQSATLSPESIRKTGRMLIWPGMFRRTGEGITAEFSPKKSSAALSALIGTDGLILQSISDEGEPPAIEVVPWEQVLRA